jgi:phosphoheptose isomerase
LMGLEVIFLCGKDPSPLTTMVHRIHVKSTNTARIQECHEFILHLFCEDLENDPRCS